MYLNIKYTLVTTLKMIAWVTTCLTHYSLAWPIKHLWPDVSILKWEMIETIACDRRVYESVANRNLS